MRIGGASSVRRRRDLNPRSPQRGLHLSRVVHSAGLCDVSKHSRERCDHHTGGRARSRTRRTRHRSTPVPRIGDIAGLSARTPLRSIGTRPSRSGERSPSAATQHRRRSPLLSLTRPIMRRSAGSGPGGAAHHRAPDLGVERHRRPRPLRCRRQDASAVRTRARSGREHGQAAARNRSGIAMSADASSTRARAHSSSSSASAATDARSTNCIRSRRATTASIPFARATSSV